MSDKIICVYGIYRKSDKHCIYIGSTTDFQNRKDWHIHDTNSYPERKPYKLILENGGWENHQFYILQKLDSHHGLINHERLWYHKEKPLGNTMIP